MRFVRTVILAGAAVCITAQRASTPHTPWDDTDLQGAYTNIYENGTAFERPDQFAGRRLERQRAR